MPPAKVKSTSDSKVVLMIGNFKVQKKSQTKRGGNPMTRDREEGSGGLDHGVGTREEEVQAVGPGSVRWKGETQKPTNQTKKRERRDLTRRRTREGESEGSVCLEGRKSQQRASSKF